MTFQIFIEYNHPDSLAGPGMSGLLQGSDEAFSGSTLHAQKGELQFSVDPPC